MFNWKQAFFNKGETYYLKPLQPALAMALNLSQVCHTNHRCLSSRDPKMQLHGKV